jgi:hypothetical protein
MPGAASDPLTAHPEAKAHLWPAALVCGWLAAAAAIANMGHQHRARVSCSIARGVLLLDGLRLLPFLFGKADQARQHILPCHDAVQILHLYRPAAAEAFARKVRCCSVSEQSMSMAARE